MSDQYAGPYDKDKCHFCGKSARNGPEFVAGYTKQVDGKLVDSCQVCLGIKPKEETKNG